VNRQPCESPLWLCHQVLWLNSDDVILSEEKRRPSGALAADSLTQLAAAGHSLSDVSGAIGAARLEGLAKGLEALGGETAADPDVSAAALTLRAGRSCYRMV
jgi:hypothetical protein